jgi:hypothetical protein
LARSFKIVKILLVLIVVVILAFSTFIYPSSWAYYEVSWDVTPGGEYRVNRITNERQVMNGTGERIKWITSGKGKINNEDKEWNPLKERD